MHADRLSCIHTVFALPLKGQGGVILYFIVNLTPSTSNAPMPSSLMTSHPLAYIHQCLQNH